jgi:hypothetical protein
MLLESRVALSYHRDSSPEDDCQDSHLDGCCQLQVKHREFFRCKISKMLKQNDFNFFLKNFKVFIKPFSSRAARKISRKSFFMLTCSAKISTDNEAKLLFDEIFSKNGVDKQSCHAVSRCLIRCVELKRYDSSFQLK